MEQNPFSKFYLSMYVRQKRDSLGLSAEFVCNSLKLDHFQYCQMENGEDEFSLDIIERLSELLCFRDQDINDLLQFANIAQANDLAAEFFEEETL